MAQTAVGSRALKNQHGSHIEEKQGTKSQLIPQTAHTEVDYARVKGIWMQPLMVHSHIHAQYPFTTFSSSAMRLFCSGSF